MKLKSQQAKKIAGDLEKTAEAADLIYLEEKQLTVCRKRRGRGFAYFEGGKKIKDPKRIERFKSLVIPPAWKNVRISPVSNAHLQALGIDDKGRKQYRYHPLWSKIRNSTKFFRMLAFGEALSAIRKKIKQDLRQSKMTKTKCLALVIRLMEDTHIRIGSEYYAQENKSYGLTTMRDRHVVASKDMIRFEFKGKKGIQHTVELTDQRLQKWVIQCEEISGRELFQYYDEEGGHHAIDSGMVNDYIRQIGGDSFTAKDFRTWAASKIFLEKLLQLDEPELIKERKKNIIEACSFSAQRIGNTRSVCKKYYIHPALIEKYLSGCLNVRVEKEEVSSAKTSELDAIEKLMLENIKNYSFTINDE